MSKMVIRDYKRGRQRGIPADRLRRLLVEPARAILQLGQAAIDVRAGSAADDVFDGVGALDDGDPAAGEPEPVVFVQVGLRRLVPADRVEATECAIVFSHGCPSRGAPLAARPCRAR